MPVAVSRIADAESSFAELFGPGRSTGPGAERVSFPALTGAGRHVRFQHEAVLHYERAPLARGHTVTVTDGRRVRYSATLGDFNRDPSGELMALADALCNLKRFPGSPYEETPCAYTVGSDRVLSVNLSPAGNAVSEVCVSALQLANRWREARYELVLQFGAGHLGEYPAECFERLLDRLTG